MTGSRLLGAHEPRVVEIKTENHATRRRHTLSGYLVDDDLVLTCGHDVVGADRVSARQILAAEFTEAEVIWPAPDEPGLDRSQVDVALLRVPGLAAPSGRVIWGELTGFDSEEPARCIGFPKSDQRGDEYAAAVVGGTVVPIEAAGQPRMKFTVPTFEPVEDSGWTGLSGAMVLSERCLLGVAAELDPGRARVLDVVPSKVILDQPRLAAALGDPELHLIAADHPLIRNPFEPIGVETDFKLITARYGQVPFVSESHGEELERLLRWCEEDDGGGGVSIRVLTGPAGSGKTRLAAELCKRLPKENQEWSTGFAVDDADKPWGSFLPRKPLLIVFDYVERPAITSRVIDFLQHLERLGDLLQSPVRVLLVSRATGGWYDQLSDRGGGFLHKRLREEGESVRLTLSRDAFDGHRRRAHFIEAFERFTRGRGNGADAADLLDQVDDDQYDSPLLVHIAALLAARGETLPEPGPTGLREQLLDHLLRRERTKRWVGQDGLSTNKVSPAECDQALHAVAIMTMTLPTVREATNLLRASELWSDQSNANRREAANALVRLYPDSEDGRSRRAAAIEPDLISEHLLVSVDDLDDILTQLLRLDLESTHYSRLVHLLSLTCDHYPDTIERFQHALSITLAGIAGDDDPSISTAEVLDLNLNRLIGIARNEVAESHHPRVTSMLTTLLEQESNDERVAQIVAGTDITASRDVAALASLSKALHSLQIRYFRDTGNDRELVGALEGVAEAQILLGFEQAGFEALREAKELRERLDAIDGDSCDRHLAALARLRDLWIANGQFESAVLAANQFAEILSSSGITDVEAYAESIATWSEAGVALRRADDPQSALGVIMHSVRVRRELGMIRRSDYADSIRELEQLTVMLTDLDRRRDAREAALEAVRLRKLVGDSDAEKYEECFAYLEGEQSAGDEFRMESIRELLGIKRWLASKNESFKVELAASLERHGNHLWLRHQEIDAIEPFREAVTIRAELAFDIQSKIMLAKALADLGIAQWISNMKYEAATSLREFSLLWVDVAERSSEYWPSAVRALEESAVALWESGQNKDALQVMREAATHEQNLRRHGKALSPWQLQDHDSARLGDRETLISTELKAQILNRSVPRHLPYNQEMSEVLELLAGLHAELGNYESADRDLHQAMMIRDSLLSSNQAAHWDALRADVEALVETRIKLGNFGRAKSVVKEMRAHMEARRRAGAPFGPEDFDARGWLEQLGDRIFQAERPREGYGEVWYVPPDGQV